jgi:hypothetical protein
MLADVFLRRMMFFSGGLAALALVVGALVAVVKLQPYGVPEPLRPAYQKRVDAIRKADEASRTGDLASVPRAEIVGQSKHDFGLMDPRSEAQHTFLIKNIGGGELILEAGPTTCKCTLSQVSAKALKPGETGEVTLTWASTGKQRKSFTQTAIVRTNDPTQAELQLQVSGRIRSLLAVDPPELNFAGTDPGKPRSTKVVVYSQAWSEFGIDLVEPSDELSDALTWQVEPLAPEKLTKFDAKMGYLVTVTLNSDAINGYFNGALRLHVIPPQPIEPSEGDENASEATEQSDVQNEVLIRDRIDEVFAAKRATNDEAASSREQLDDQGRLVRELVVRGNILDRISIYGPGLDERAGLTLGVVDTTEGCESKLIVKVRGNRQPAFMRVGKVYPEYLDASIEPMGDREGYYTLKVRVPKGVPVDLFNADDHHGYVSIETDLSETGQRVLPVFGAVVDQTRSLQ